jgi:hypothetical protein
MSYSVFITDFLRRVQLPRLSAGEPLPDKELIQKTTAAKEHEISRATGSQASCARGLLLLAAGDLDQAHRTVQEISTPDAAYIHGVIHRIDDDFNNARYWFRRAGMHPAGTEMYRRAAVFSPMVERHSTWDSIQVTDMVEASRTFGVTDELRAILTIEFEELLRSVW